MDAESWIRESEESAPVAVSRGGRPAKHKRAQAKRMRKLECPDCGFIAYATSATALCDIGFPTCACGARMTLVNLRDRVDVEPERLERELGAAGFAGAMRELGYLDMVAPLDANGRLVSRARRSGAAQPRCQWEHGYCAKYVSGRYCPEHDPHAARAA